MPSPRHFDRLSPASSHAFAFVQPATSYDRGFPMTKVQTSLLSLALVQSRKRGSIGRLGFATAVPVVLAFCLAVAGASPAQVFTVLASLNGKDGGVGEGLLTQGNDGNYYALAGTGGTNGDDGTVINGTPGCG